MAEEKVAPKSEEKPKENENGEKVKTQNKKLLWILGGCCGCLIILIILAALSSGFFGWRFRAGADIPIPSFSKTPTFETIIEASPTDSTFPAATACAQVETPASAALGVSPTSPGLKKNIENHYFNLYGSTIYQLRQQLADCGPKNDGGSWGAYTAYNINYIYDYAPGAGLSCGIKNVAVGIQVDIYLPKWEEPSSFAARLDKSWSNYINALTLHENGHRDYNIDAASEILSALNNFGTYSSCDEAGSAANAKGQEILDNLKSTNGSYDASTNHGETQGAVLQ